MGGDLRDKADQIISKNKSYTTYVVMLSVSINLFQVLLFAGPQRGFASHLPWIARTQNAEIPYTKDPHIQANKTTTLYNVQILTKSTTHTLRKTEVPVSRSPPALFPASVGFPDLFWSSPPYSALHRQHLRRRLQPRPWQLR